LKDPVPRGTGSFVFRGELTVVDVG